MFWMFVNDFVTQVNLSLDGSLDSIEQVEQVAREASFQVSGV